MKDGKAQVNIRLAMPHDARAIEHFYTTNEHAFVAFRPERLASLIIEQALVVAEADGIMVGAAGILCHGTSSGRHWIELVQGRVILEGLGLYRLLIACRLLLIENRYPSSALVFCEVDEVNMRVRSIYSSLGFVTFAPDPELEQISIETLPLNKRPQSLGYGFVWYKANSSIRASIIEQLCHDTLYVSSSPLDGAIIVRFCDNIHSMIKNRCRQ
jgi:hypothetical protein